MKVTGAVGCFEVEQKALRSILYRMTMVLVWGATLWLLCIDYRSRGQGSQFKREEERKSTHNVLF